MENQYDLDELQRSKEDLEQLVARHYKGQKKQKTLPAKLEQDFWKFNIDRTRINAIQFFGQGVITYTTFVLLIFPSKSDNFKSYSFVFKAALDIVFSCFS